VAHDFELVCMSEENILSKHWPWSDDLCKQESSYTASRSRVSIRGSPCKNFPHI